ncbi:hypothetical protein V2G26_017995 [Clonostachys chloroleuca]
MRANRGPLLFSAAMASGAAALVSPDGIGRLPALGWSSWNEYGCDINETVLLRVSELVVDLGLQELGYEYINIDDCWSDKEKRRDNSTGRILVDKVKFPNGINGLAEEVHAKRLKLGIYSDAGTLTCGGYEGSLGHEEVDAATFADWGIDYLKYDNCNVPEEWTDEYIYYPEDPNNVIPPPGYSYGDSKTAVRYNRMRDALLHQNRTIQYSLCAWGHARVEQWGNGTGHSWRMFGDIFPEWSGKHDYSWGVLPILNQAARHWNDTGFWGHNDWDMLEVGNGNLTYEESRSHFALWAALKSPLIIGTKLEGVKPEILEILKNRELIEFNQDKVYSDSVRPYGLNGPVPITTPDIVHPPNKYVGTSVKGLHVFLLNTEDQEREFVVDFKDVPGLRSARHVNFLVHDMWTGEDIGEAEKKIKIKISAHDTAALRFTTIDGQHPNPNWTPSLG